MTNRTIRSALSLSDPVKPRTAVNRPVMSFLIAIGVGICLGSPGLAGSLAQKSEAGTDHKEPSRITATPESVRIAAGSANTNITWNTGNGSVGFVFVTANGQSPVLVARGIKGSRVISWIRPGRYVFELYSDAERQTLLGTVTVSGVAETGGPSLPLWREQLRWMVVAALIAILYGAIFWSSPGPVRSKFPLEPTTSPYPVHVARNLLLGLAAFICVDGVIFHTSLYTSILAPDSYAGRMEAITRAEKERVPSNLKEVLVLGDSRMAEGFSAPVANKLSSVAGLKFVNLAEPASTVNIWDYMLREVDPTRRRYWAIVVPYGIGYEPNSADRLRISMAGPLLRYGDCFNFASAFQQWSGRFRAFTACIFRGSAFQSDVVNFLEHPIARIRNVRQESKRLHARDVYKGRNYDIVGTSYDPGTGQLTFPPRLTEAQRAAIRDSLEKPSQSETQDFLEMQRGGIQRILNRYSPSSTKIVLTPVPRGPFAGLPGASMTFQTAFPPVTTQRAVFSIPGQTFDFLEKPEYYFDGYHLNAKGRQKFTETLVGQLVGRLRPASVNDRLRFDSRIAGSRFPLGNSGQDVTSLSGVRLGNRLTSEAN